MNLKKYKYLFLYYYNKYFKELIKSRKIKLLTIGLGIAAGISFFWLKNLSPSPAHPISPLADSPAINQSKNEENYNSISYYITISQEFLTKARALAEETSKLDEKTGLTREQTPEEKQKIIELINQALDVINQGIAAYPTDDRVFAQRANIYQALTPFLPEAGKFAIQDLREAIKLNKQNPEHHLNLANLYLKAGNFEGAAFSFYNAYQLTPTNIQTLYNLADALEKSGQLPKAKIYFEKLLSLLSFNDQNRPILEKRLTLIKETIAKADLKYLSEPGEIAPLVVAEPEIIGTQELPLEEAAVIGKVIIANNQQAPSTQESTAILINAKSGEGIIPPKEKEVTIYNKNVTNNNQIVIVPLSGDFKNKVIFVSARKNGEWFKIGIDTPSDYEIKFKWWITE